jgi:c-di-GMP-binding flagellar brake protein YcgR
MGAMFEDTRAAALDEGNSNADWAEFRVENPREIAALFKQLLDGSVPVNLLSPGGAMFSSNLWAVDGAQQRITFSADPHNPQLQQLIDDDEATGVSYLDAVKLQFDLNHLMLVHGAKASALQARMPPLLYRFQRRDSYRVRTLERDQPRAELRHPSLPDMRLLLRVMDVSGGGCALFLPHDVPAIAPGIVLQGVLIELDADTRFNATVSIRHVSNINQAANGQRLGCEFTGLSPNAQRTLQLYIDQTQKRRRLLVLE